MVLDRFIKPLPMFQSKDHGQSGSSSAQRRRVKARKQ